MQILKWIISIFFIAISIFLIIYFLGPTPPNMTFAEQLPVINLDTKEYVSQQNNEQPLRPGNEAEIVFFNDSLKNQTEYVLVYIHGFGASEMEGDPIHREFAKRYGMNLYLHRVADHGLNVEQPLIDLTADKMMRSAEEALAIGKELGKKVILMSCSTGGTLSIPLAAKFPTDVEALILFSPNVDIFDPNSKWLARPWGLKIARFIMGSENREWNPGTEAQKYWYAKYRLEGLVALKSLINQTMIDENFAKVKQPVLMMYYYKNEEEQDKIVSVKRMREMFGKLGTPEKLKRNIPLPNAGHHIISSSLFSTDLEGVRKNAYDFAEKVLQLEQVI